MANTIERKGLVKIIRRAYGYIYTTDRINEILDSDGVAYFNNSLFNIGYEYIGFGKYQKI